MARINKNYHKDAKEQITAAAIEVAATKGWDAVTLDAIAQNVGVTIPALYSYFKNRDALLDEAFLEVIRNTQADIETTLARESDIHQVVLNFADHIFIQQNLNSKIFFQIPARFFQDPNKRKIAKIFKDTGIIIRNMLVQAKSKGEIPRQVDPETATRLIFAITMGLQFPIFEKEDVHADRDLWIEAVERCLLIDPHIRNKQ